MSNQRYCRHTIQRHVASVALVSGLAAGAAAGHAQVSPPAQPAAAAPLVLQGVTVIDVRRGERRSNQAVVIAGTRIRTIGPTGRVTVPREATVVDARGKYLIPGLWDLHVHLRQHVDLAFPLLVANGVTGVRDAGTHIPLATLAQWKREIAAGTRVGPRYLVSGPVLNDGQIWGDAQTTITTSAPTDTLGGDYTYAAYIGVPRSLARYAVDSLKAAGADFLKFYMMGDEMYFALAAEARRAGILFGGHLYPTPHIDGVDASDSGVTFLDHESETRVCGQGKGDSASFDAGRCAAAAQRFRRNHTWVTMAGWSPKVGAQGQLAAFDTPARVLARYQRYLPASFPDRDLSVSAAHAAVPEPTSTAAWRAYAAQYAPDDNNQIARLHTAGMPLVIGTDANLTNNSGYYARTPGFSVHQVLVEFVVRGLTPLEALQTATLNPAQALRATDSLGTVEAGKVADLVLLDADPLADIWHTTMIRALVANGRYYDRAALDALLAEAERVAGER